MLKTMREGSAIFVKGVMIVVVVTFVGTIFMVWGVGSTPGDLSRRGIAAVVGNVEIPVNEYREAYRRQVDTYKQLFGDKLDEKLLESLNFKQQVLDHLIRQVLIQQYAERNNIMVGPDELTAEIQQIPAFGGKDGFSRQRYLAVLKANNFTPERFEREMGRDLTERKTESLIRDSVKVSEAETREIFQQARRQLTVEVAQLPAGDDGKKLAETISVAVGKGKTLSAASREAGALVKTYGPFPAMAPPEGIPDPEVFRQAAIVLKPGEMSPLVTGQKASYLLRLESQQEPSTEEFEKEKPTFQTQVLLSKREAVVADWVLELRQKAKVVVQQDSL